MPQVYIAVSRPPPPHTHPPHTHTHTVSSGIIQSLNLTMNETEHISSSFYVDRRFIIAIAACVFILPWLFFKKIGVLSYTRSVCMYKFYQLLCLFFTIFSFIAVLCCFYIAAVVTTRYFTGDTADCQVSNVVM